MEQVKLSVLVKPADSSYCKDCSLSLTLAQFSLFVPTETKIA